MVHKLKRFVQVTPGIPLLRFQLCNCTNMTKVLSTLEDTLGTTCYARCSGLCQIYDFQNLQKAGPPNFLEFHPGNIYVFKVIFKT